MPAETDLEPARLKELVLRVLGENRTMTIATLRPDGWPQATIVGFVHEDMTLYFVVAQRSQKLANLRRDSRASVAIGLHVGEARYVRGCSMAVRVEEVTQFHEIERLNKLVRARYPGVAVFAPRQSLSAVLRATPELISIVDDTAGLHQPMLLRVSSHVDLAPAEADRGS